MLSGRGFMMLEESYDIAARASSSLAFVIIFHRGFSNWGFPQNPSTPNESRRFCAVKVNAALETAAGTSVCRLDRWSVR